MELTHSRCNRIAAALVFAIACVVFVLTAAPTVAFWDCGEYVAAGFSLGVPHPPGNPLFMLMLRCASILFAFLGDVGYRMTLLVILASAMTAMLIYLTTVRVGLAFTGIPDTNWKRLSLYVGGAVGALFAVFGSTFWFSAVEQSEANPSMMVVALSTWLALVWAQSTDGRRDRWLILLTYVAFLGIGIHMYSMIVLPAIFLMVILLDAGKRHDWRLWLTATMLGVVIVDMPLFIQEISIGGGVIPIGVGPLAVLLTATMMLVDTKNSGKWQFCFLLSLFAVIGFSSHLSIPIRSALEPAINENHPDSWAAFKEFLQRKQYGSESMIARMFWRRGSWAHQLGIEGHMGYGGFHLTQFFRFSPHDTERSMFHAGPLAGTAMLLVYLVPTFAMIWAWVQLHKKDRNAATLLVSMFLLASIGLVLYMNFADGTRPERRDYLWWVNAGRPGPMPVVHREVRVRDYFFGAAFMQLGMWLGIASIAVACRLFCGRNAVIRTKVAPIVLLLLAVSPVLPLTQNWSMSSRRGDWVPYDYAYNLLMSCERDGVLFTNGDNDTFPLWALQEAYGIRRDVRIVNLSLLNTTWYIKQLRDLEPKVPISYTHREIDTQLKHAQNPFPKSFEYTLPNADITVVLPGRDRQSALRIQDLMVLNIVDSNRWRKPVYFATTVPAGNLMGLERYLKMEGMVFRVMPRPVPQSQRIDITRSVYLLDKVYRFTGLGTGKTELNGTAGDMLSNYAALFIQVAIAMQEQPQAPGAEAGRQEASADSSSSLAAMQKAHEGSVDRAVEMLDRCVSLIPWDWRPRTLRYQLLMANGRADLAEAGMREALKIDPDNADYKRMLTQAQASGGKREAGENLR